MTFEAAVRLTEILLAVVVIQQSLEHLATPDHNRWLFSLRVACCLFLLSGWQSTWAMGGLAALSLAYLKRFQGPYNGGSDRMTILVTWSVFLSHLMPDQTMQETVFAYLAVQLVLSYFVSGWVKLTNPEWRSGNALREVFDFSAYPVCEQFRKFADATSLCLVMSWAVILFEVLFPLALLHQSALIIAMIVAATFHLANACLFGLNRFFWTWLTAYPSLIWFQTHIVAAMF